MAMSRAIQKTFEKEIRHRFFKDHHEIIPLVELDEVYRHFSRIDKTNYKFKISFADYVEKWKNNGYKIQ